MAIFLLVAILINMAVLKIFGQKSSYRAVHSLIGIIMLMGFVSTFAGEKISRSKIGLLFCISLIPCYLGTVLSDLDIRLLGIGSHRNPLFHSGLAFFLLFFIFKKFNSFAIVAIVSAFGVGLGSHLIWDLFDKADVRWIPGGSLDRMWLGANGAICLVMSKRNLSLRFNKYNGLEDDIPAGSNLRPSSLEGEGKVSQAHASNTSHLL